MNSSTREVVDMGYAQVTRREKLARVKHMPAPTSPGTSRDYACRDDAQRVFAIADGVGHSVNAAEAARATCETFVSYFMGEHYPENARSARRRIKGGLLDLLNTAASMHHAATTLTGVVVTPDSRVTYLHAGDSQLLICRKGEVIPMTSEQTEERDGSKLLNYFGHSSEWQPHERRPELALTRHRNEISQTRLEVEWGSFKLRNNDILLLVTDGVLGDTPNERLTPEEWRRSTRRELGAQAIADSLVWYSKKVDDTTATVLRFGARQNRLKHS